MTTRYDVVISGSGLTGLAAAAALAKLNRSALLLVPDQTPNTSDQASEVRTTAVSPASKRWFEKSLEIDVRGTPISRMHVWESEGSAAIDFDCNDVGKPYLAWVTNHQKLVDAIRTQLKGKVEIRSDVDVTLLDQRNQQLVLSDGSNVGCELFIVADGAQSGARDLLDVKVHRQKLDQIALVSILTTEKQHENVAYQRFGDGVLAFLPYLERNQVSLIWSMQSSRFDQMNSLEESSFCERVTLESEHVLGDVTKAEQRASFPLSQTLVDSFAPLPWVLIIGDAAHSIHPLAGQGANLALEDVRTLARLIEGDASTLNDPQKLAGYAKRRKMRARAFIAAMSFFLKSWQQDNPYFRLARNVGISSIDRLPALKRRLIQEAMGYGPIAKLF